MEKYTDNESRSSWKILDKNALNDFSKELDVSNEEAEALIEDYSIDSDDINSHLFAVLEIGGNKFLDKVKLYCDEHNIDYSGSKLNDNTNEILNVYINYMDSGFDSDLSDLISSNPSEDDIKATLSLLEIEYIDNSLEMDN